MNSVSLRLAALSFLPLAALCADTNQVIHPGPNLSSVTNRSADVSYAIGVDIARHFRRLGIEVDEEQVRRGFADGLSGDRLRMPESESRRIVVTIQNEAMQRGANIRRNPASLNRYEADTFLGLNQKRPGVVTLPSGLQYRVLTQGTGPKPVSTAHVVCHYRYTYLDGSEFSASEPSKPVHFVASEATIKAWSEALPLMPKGAKWRLFIPSDLAYGKVGLGKEIGPDMGLICDLELVEIE